MGYPPLVNLLGMAGLGNKLYGVFDILPNFAFSCEQDFKSASLGMLLLRV